MKNLKLILTVAVVSLLQTACGGGDKSSITPTATQNACWSSGNANSSACQTLAQAVGHPISSAEVPAKGQSQLANATGISNPAAVASSVGVASPTGMVVASVTPPSEASVKAQAQKIQTALSSYSEDPDSSFYDPSAAAAKRSTASVAVTPSEIAPVAAPAPAVVATPSSVLANAENASSSGGTSR